MMTIRQVGPDNIREIERLDVRDDQQRFVITARDSIKEAQEHIARGGWAAALGIYDGEVPVGFAMFTYGNLPEFEGRPTFSPDVYEFNRFYIDKRYQGKGYARPAFRLAVDFVRSLPNGPAGLCWLGVKPDNAVARHLYSTEGFTLTDIYHLDEAVYILPLSDGGQAGS